MSARRYRLCIVILLLIFVSGSLYFDFVTSQNGRFMQYDRRGEFSPDGASHHQNPKILDTRTGKIVQQ